MNKSGFKMVNTKRSWKLLNKYGLEKVNTPKKLKEIAKQEWPNSFVFPNNADSYLQEFVEEFKQVYQEAKQGKVNTDNSYKQALELEKEMLMKELAFMDSRIDWVNHRLEYLIKELNK